MLLGCFGNLKAHTMIPLSSLHKWEPVVRCRDSLGDVLAFRTRPVHPDDLEESFQTDGRTRWGLVVAARARKLHHSLRVGSTVWNS